MQTILDGIMGSVLWQIAWRLIVLLIIVAGFDNLMFYLGRHIHIYWK